jgi:predicted small secreted protein
MREKSSMKLSRLLPVAVLISALFVASCANTIRGFGRDAGNAVDATEDAATDIAN